MAELVLNLIKGDKVGSETDYRDSLPVNMVAISKHVLGAAGYMLQSPGLTQYGTGQGVDRGGLWNERQENHYRISGNSFISVAADGTVATEGTISGSDTAALPYSYRPRPWRPYRRHMDR